MEKGNWEDNLFSNAQSHKHGNLSSEPSTHLKCQAYGCDTHTGKMGIGRTLRPPGQPTQPLSKLQFQGENSFHKLRERSIKKKKDLS